MTFAVADIETPVPVSALTLPVLMTASSSASSDSEVSWQHVVTMSSSRSHSMLEFTDEKRGEFLIWDGLHGLWPYDCTYGRSSPLVLHT